MGNEMNDSHEYALTREYGAMLGYATDGLGRPVRVENISHRRYTQLYKTHILKVRE